MCTNNSSLGYDVVLLTNVSTVSDSFTFPCLEYCCYSVDNVDVRVLRYVKRFPFRVSC